MTVLGRHLTSAREPAKASAGSGQMYVAVIGIDRYRAWAQLRNAVQDAVGTRDAFAALGFKPVGPELFNEAATGVALRRLVTDDLRALGTSDSLVLFFAGHGHTTRMEYPDGTLTKTGYLIPADADLPTGSVGTWLNLDGWLREVASLPPKHILVILDTCHSGVALNPVIRWRGSDMRLPDPLEQLRARRSRRILTSALDDQLAVDSGPLPGHSLFTGCLIEALTGGVAGHTAQSVLTGSQLGAHVQQRVSTYPSSQQTPDFGALEHDKRGELIIELRQARAPQPEQAAQPLVSPTATGPHDIWPRGIEPKPATSNPIADAGRHTPPVGVDAIKSSRITRPAAHSPAITASTSAQSPPAKSPPVHSPPAHSPPAHSPPAQSPPVPAPTSAQSRPIAPTPAPAPAPVVNATPGQPSGSPLDAAFVAALERHDVVRRRGGQVLTVVTADPMTAVTGWATWAAGRGQLTLLTEKTGLDAVIIDLLAQVPWLRALPGARSRLAASAGLDVQAVDDAIDTRTAAERAASIDRMAGHDLRARVSGWLLSALRDPWSLLPDLTTAPVQGGDLLSIACELAAPITVMFHHPAPAAPWVERAIRTASELVAFLPRRAIAVGAPSELVVEAVRANPESSALARQGMVPLASRAPRHDASRTRAELALHAALARDPRTTGMFEPSVPVPTHDHERPADVDLFAKDAALAIEIDDWYRFRDPQAYRRDRIKDIWLQRAGFFVMRFLADDVEDRLEHTIDEIAIGLAGRRASGSLAESSQ